MTDKTCATLIRLQKSLSSNTSQLCAKYLYLNAIGVYTTIYQIMLIIFIVYLLQDGIYFLFELIVKISNMQLIQNSVFNYYNVYYKCFKVTMIRQKVFLKKIDFIIFYIKHVLSSWYTRRYLGSMRIYCVYTY